MIGQISQVSIQPVSSDIENTDLFEITSDSDELFLPVVQSNNVVITNTSTSNATTITENTSVSTVSIASSSGSGNGGGY